MIAAPAFDQRDRPRQRRPASGAKVFGQCFDVDGGIARQGHVLVYNGKVLQARGTGPVCTVQLPHSFWASSSLRMGPFLIDVHTGRAVDSASSRRSLLIAMASMTR